MRAAWVPRFDPTSDRKRPDSEMAIAEYGHGTFLQRTAKLVEVGQHGIDLVICPSCRPSPKQDHAWSRATTVGQDHPEVWIGRDDDAALLGSAVEDQGIRSRRQALVTDMDRIMTGRAEQIGHARRQARVNQEPHAPRRMGSSRSRRASAAYSRAALTSSASRYG